MPSKLNLVGQKYGMLTVVSETRKYHKVAWECVCECGNKTVVITGPLRNGNTKSCGCLKAIATAEKNFKHGLSKTSEYESWQCAKKRCFNPKDRRYSHYGARGITMFSGWVNDFKAFYEHIGPKPDDNQRWSIGRIDNNGNYEPGNVRWETDEQQARNHSLQTNNTSGITGISRRERVINGRVYSTFTSKVQYSGTEKSKEISIDKHGEEQALKLICEWREGRLKELEQQGIVYAESHGK